MNAHRHRGRTLHGGCAVIRIRVGEMEEWWRSAVQRRSTKKRRDVMSAGSFVMRKFLSILRFVVSCLKRVLCCLRGHKGVDSLPFTVHDNGIDSRRHFNTSELENQWNNWNKDPFTNVIEEKIDEYRRKKIEMLTQQETTQREPDFFTDMQPNVKRTRKAFVGSSSGDVDTKKENLFAFKDEGIPFIPASNELGDLDESSTLREDRWDTQIDIDDVDDLLKEQRKRERLEKQRARLAEHERRVAEKRSLHS
uniref:Receptor-binding cancer antigen expressed on SiSo cells n=1 Tax=Ascaris lumbricoides TaxID=6252 RepID=A0A9J2PTG8_ASCLU